MKTRIVKLVTITMAVAAAGLLSGAGWLQPVEAQSGDGTVKFVHYASLGIAPGERVRLSAANTAEATGNLTLSFSFYLAHGSNSSSSVPLYESELISVPPGEFRFSDVWREYLNTEGEPETRRAQVIVRITSNQEDFPGSLEIIKDEVQGGEIDSKYRLIILAAKRSKQLSAPTGLILDHSLRYTFLNPNEEGSVRVQAYSYDSYGNLLSQTDPVVLRPGQSHIFDINRDDLRVAGEEKTGRLQVRGVIQVALMDASVRPVKLHVSMEHVNNQTGSTAGGPYFTGSVTVSGDGFGD